MTQETYHFRVSIQDAPLSNFLLHVSVQQDQDPLYQDLLKTVKHFTKTDFIGDHDYHMIIAKDDGIQYNITNDMSLKNAFRSITTHDIYQIKLIKKCNDIVPLVKPVFTRRPSYYMNSEEQHFKQERKDSGICLEQELEELHSKDKKETSIKMSRKLPELSKIITTPPLWLGCSNNFSLPSPPQPGFHSGKASPEEAFNNYKSPIKLPGLSYLMMYQTFQCLQKQQLPPIITHHHPSSSVFSSKPLSPPLSVSSFPSPSPPSPVLRKSNKAYNKRTRGGTSNQSQFICQHVIDTATGKKCCQAFCRSYDLSRHQSMHLKNRPLCYCHECGKKFTRLDALRRHERIQDHNNK